MPRSVRPVDVANQAIRNGVGSARFKISREQADKLRKIEARDGKEAGLTFLLKLLRSERV
jgi:hypothetical protein